MSSRQIAAEMGISHSAAAGLVTYARKARLRAQLRTYNVPLAGALWQRLEAAAADRGMTPPALAAQILKYVLDDNIVEAVLDETPEAGK